MKKDLSIALALFFCISAGFAQLKAPSSVSYNGTFVNTLKNGIFRSVSDNGMYKASYDIGAVSDENRTIENFKLYLGDDLLYRKTVLPGADLYISNAGYVAVMNMDKHYMHSVTVQLFDPNGNLVWSEPFTYASLFGFSPGGCKFVTGTDQSLTIYDAEVNTIHEVDRCSQFAFADDEQWLATAFEGQLTLYSEYIKKSVILTGLFYPRAVAVNSANDCVAVIGKKKLKVYGFSQGKHIETVSLDEHFSFRDLRMDGNEILAGVHYRHNGVSRGFLYTYDSAGKLTKQIEMASKSFQTFTEKYTPTKNAMNYETIPWPFVPFDEVHKVWNHYEQHMGDGSGDWSYLHQGLDLETPINEPTYAVQAGVVKLVLTLGGESYWRIAVAPEQTSAPSDGWLYAHIVPSSIQVDVGDYVDVHDYLGDIIYWSDDWGHIHFVNIHDQGTIWYYDDDEWGINFNPLLALDPITDNVAPVIDDFSTNSKFGFCMNETSSYLNPQGLTGDIDIIALISDYHSFSEWEQPAFKTYYWFNKLPENTTIFPKTLGQILNHSYTQYHSGYYENYAPLMYKKDFQHPSPPWMWTSREYYQVLTNNNGDSIAEPFETSLAFNTANFPDGQYRLFVEAWDEFGNTAIDSQDVTFDNGISEVLEHPKVDHGITCSPSPAKNNITFSFSIDSHESGKCKLSLFDVRMKNILHKEFSAKQDENNLSLPLDGIKPGMYFIVIETTRERLSGKFIKQ